MSKIEKALNKSRESGNLRVVVPERAEQSNEGMLVRAKTTALAEHHVSADMVARMQEKSLLGRQVLAQNRIICPELGENGVVRAFREIRTKIIQKTQGRNAVVMVTSTGGAGGSSFVTANLGVAFAFDAGKTALLMDCNLRNPSLHQALAFNAGHGLTDFLDNPDLDVARIIHPVGIERLRLVPSGSQRGIPAEHFTSARMKHLMDGIKQRYHERYIILDAPPMTESADTQILADLCDYVLLVVAYGKATETQIQASVKAIGEKKLLGVVFNNEPALPDIPWGRALRRAFSGFLG